MMGVLRLLLKARDIWDISADSYCRSQRATRARWQSRWVDESGLLLLLARHRLLLQMLPRTDVSWICAGLEVEVRLESVLRQPIIRGSVWGGMSVMSVVRGRRSCVRVICTVKGYPALCMCDGRDNACLLC